MADGVQDDVVSARRLYGEWDEGRGTPKSEIERREWGDSRANGRRFDRFVLQHLGVTASRRKQADRLPEFTWQAPPPVEEIEEDDAAPAAETGPVTPEQWLEHARSECLQALKAWNDANLPFRTGSFSTSFLMAWNSLALSMLLRDGVEWRVLKDGKPIVRRGMERPLDIITLIDRAFPDQINAGLRQNLRFWVDLRGAIGDRSIPALDQVIDPYVQAGLVNFERTVVDGFGEEHRLGRRLSVPLPLSASDEALAENSRIRTVETLPLEVEAVLNRAEKTTPHLISDRTFMLQVALVPMPTQAPAADTRPTLGAKEVTTEVRQRIPFSFSTNDHSAVARFLNVRPAQDQPDRSLDERYCEYVTSTKAYLYNQRWIDRVVAQVSTEDGYRAAVGRDPTPA